MDKPEEIRTQLGMLRRMARDYRVTLEAGLIGKQEIGSTVHSLGIYSHSRELYSCNTPSVQPLKDFFRAYDNRRKLLYHVLSPTTFLLALRQDLEIAEAESVELSEQAQSVAA